MVKNPPVAEYSGDVGSIPGSGRPPGGGNDNPLQYSCLESPMDREARQAPIHLVSKSQTQLKQTEHAHMSLVELYSKVVSGLIWSHTKVEFPD